MNTDLEQGVRTWQRTWNAEHAAGNIIRPLRATGEAYRGINVLLLWIEAWRTYRQAVSLGAPRVHFSSQHLLQPSHLSPPSGKSAKSLRAALTHEIGRVVLR
jgi:antirestriction factor ArdC-like protein